MPVTHQIILLNQQRVILKALGQVNKVHGTDEHANEYEKQVHFPELMES